VALTFFFDRCIGKSLPEALRRADPPFLLEYFHDPKGKLKFRQNTPDDAWLPLVAQQGWFILSHDSKWHKNEAEMMAIKQHNAGCFYLYGNNSPTWYKLRAFVRGAEKIVKFAEATARPFIFRAAANGRVTPIKIK
jgi:hypothetical protein